MSWLSEQQVQLLWLSLCVFNAAMRPLQSFWTVYVYHAVMGRSRCCLVHTSTSVRAAMAHSCLNGVSCRCCILQGL